MSYILGISCGYHDSAASLIKDGIVLGACEEERFTGIKHDSSFPHNTIDWLFKKYSITKEDLDSICFYEVPFEKLDRIETSTKKGGVLKYFNRKSIISNNKTAYKELMLDIDSYTGSKTNVVFTEHHLSHAAYSYYTSPYNNAIVVSVDGVGEWETTTIYEGTKNKLKKLDSIKFPHSLGMFYSAFTAFLGFKPNEGEYKMMGLAPYGDSSRYIDKFDSIISGKEGNFKLNMDLFTYEYSDTHMFNEKLGMLLELPNRLPEEPLTQDHKDLAASVQAIYEKYFFNLLEKAFSLSSSRNLCLSGGCAYNGTANGKILESGTSNILLYKNKKVYSPKNKFYKGVTYKFFEKKIKKIIKKDIMVNSLKEYDEVILIGSGKGVASIQTINDIKWKRKSLFFYKVLFNQYKKQFLKCPIYK